ncbi:MAG: hypothetical protein ACNI25_02855 [Halarcobacter sp.]
MENKKIEKVEVKKSWVKSKVKELDVNKTAASGGAVRGMVQLTLVKSKPLRNYVNRVRQYLKM